MKKQRRRLAIPTNYLQDFPFSIRHVPVTSSLSLITYQNTPSGFVPIKEMVSSLKFLKFVSVKNNV